MALSRKTYVAVAEIIASRVDASDTHTTGFDVGYDAATGGIAHDLANYFAEDNPAFDRGRFLAACGLGG